MTSDRIKRAIIAILDGAKPDTSITVSDAQAFDEAQLPGISVGIVSAERHSAALHNYQKVQLEIKLRAHSGDDDTRTAVQSWCAAIESALNDPDQLIALINASGQQVACVFWRIDGGVPEWDDTTLVATWVADSVAYRTG